MTLPQALTNASDETLTLTSQEEPNHITERNITMKRIRTSESVGLLRLTLIVCTLVGTVGIRSGIAGDEGAKATVVFDHVIPNVPGKSMKGILVEYGPGVVSPGHIHPKSAFIYATVLEGAIRTSVNDGPAVIYRAGQNFPEMPGDRHTLDENASKTEPAKVLAVFVVDTDEKELLTPLK